VVRGAPGEAANKANPVITSGGKLNSFSSRITTKGTSTTTAKSARNSKPGFRHRESISSKQRLHPMANIREKIVILTKISNKGWCMACKIFQAQANNISKCDFGLLSLVREC
jgi:hypothetical protein